MVRAHFLSSLLLPLLLGLFAFTPIARAQAPETAPRHDLWPFKQGNTWTVETSITDTRTKKSSAITQLITVTDVVKTAAGAEATITYTSGGRQIQLEKYLSNTEGIWRISGGVDGNTKLTPMLQIVKYPISAGSKWSWVGTVTTATKPVSGTVAASVGEPEMLNLPSGIFKTTHIHFVLNLGDGKQKNVITNDFWHADGVGLVQQRISYGNTVINGTLLKYTVK